MAASHLVALGRAIHKRRDTLRLSRRELAERADVSVNRVARIERGQADPLVSTVHRIATVLGLSFEELGALVDDEAAN
jgi:predicted transcriptional regulator